jgi:signal transduction histidine kinase
MLDEAGKTRNIGTMNSLHHVLVVAREDAAVAGLQERHEGFALFHSHTAAHLHPPPDLAFALVERALVPPAGLPAWALELPVVVVGACECSDPPAPALADAALILTEAIGDLDLQSILVATRTRQVDPLPEVALDQLLKRIDDFSRRVLALDSPVAIKHRLPLLLSNMLPFTGAALWDWHEDDFQVYCPARWDQATSRRAVERVREQLTPLAGRHTLPAAATLLSFERRGQPAEPGEVAHAVTATLGSSDGLLCVFRTSDEPFAECDTRALALAANLVSYAVRNARMFSSLETQTRKIIEKNRQLAAASRIKSNFMANTSHELKTPLHSILGLTELLGEFELPADGREMAVRIGANARRLQDLVTDILDFSRLEADEESVFAEPIDLDTFGRELLEGFSDLARVRGLELVGYNQATGVRFVTDREKLFRVATNLLSNALKFTPEGRIEARLAIVDGDLEIVVSDTGVGIPGAELERIFEQFHRVKGPLQQNTEGAGLGLAIAQRLTFLLGGDINVESELGSGSTFTVRVPPRRPARPEVPGALPELE